MWICSQNIKILLLARKLHKHWLWQRYQIQEQSRKVATFLLCYFFCSYMSLHYRDGYQLNPFIPSKSGAETNLSDFYFARACLHLARVCLHLASFVSIQPGFVLEMDQIRVQMDRIPV